MILAAKHLRAFRQFVPPTRRWQFAALLAFMVAGSLAEVVTIGSSIPLIAGLVGDRATAGLPWLQPLLRTINSWGVGGSLAAVLLFVVAALASGVIRLQLSWSTQRFIFGLGHELAVEIQRRVLQQPFAFHLANNSSVVAASLEQVQIFVSAVLLQLMYALTALILSASIIAVLVQVSPLAALAALLAVAAIYFALGLGAHRSLERNSTIVGSALQERLRLVQESLGNIRDVIVDHAQRVHLSEFAEVDRRFAEARSSTAFLAGAPRIIVETGLVIFIALLALAISGQPGGIQAALPMLGVLALGAQRLVPLIQQLYASWISLRANQSLIERVTELLSLPDDETVPTAEFEPLAIGSGITLEDVSFTYPGRKRAAVNSVNVEFPRGSRTVVFGPTGSGKSTLADLVMGLLQPSTGSIKVGGKPLIPCTMIAWQMNVAHVPQSAFLADTTIARNVAFGVPESDVDMERVIEACRLAQIDHFIAALPEGYQTRAGERGVRMSGGQRQRLAIARALYKRRPVLILDEATSALDSATENAVVQSLESITDQGTIVIMIAHRLPSTFSPDRVVEMRDGRLSVRNAASDSVRRVARPS